MDKEPKSPNLGTTSIHNIVTAVGEGLRTAAIFAACLIQDSPKLFSQSLGLHSDDESLSSQYENRLTRNPSFPSFTYTPPSITNKD